MADELIDILTPKGLLSGCTKLKSEAHLKGLWHASAQIWLYTPQGDILIQKRTPNKDTYPNLWDISVAGHLSAGDTPRNAAVREIKEEIGINLNIKDLHHLKTIKNSKKPNERITDNEFNHLYICCTPIVIEKLKLQASEVADVKLISIKEFKKELKKNYFKFVPHGMDYYLYITDSITSALSVNKKTNSF